MKKYLITAYFPKPELDFKKKLFVDIFEEILIKCVELGLVSKEGMLVDSTIVKTDASTCSLVSLSPEEYWERLDSHEKRPEKKRFGRGFCKNYSCTYTLLESLIS